MPHFVCVTCGSQFAETAESPPHCPICEDERQYVGREVQRRVRDYLERMADVEPEAVDVVVDEVAAPA